jgi:hypothetical protein
MVEDNPMKRPGAVENRREDNRDPATGVVRWPGTSKKSIKKRTNTYLRKTGFKHWASDPANMEVRRQKWLEDTGFGHPMQDPVHAAKVLLSEKKAKIFVANDGSTHKCRGYEPNVLKFIDESPDVAHYTTVAGTDLLPAVPYTKGPTITKFSTYYPDIGVLLKDGRRLIIEVESVYTLWSDEHINRRKFQAADRFCDSCACHTNTTFWLAIVDDRTKEITWVSRSRVF